MSLEIRDKLRVICHSLRMRTWESLDPFALADIHSRIRKLPSAEKISIMADNDLEGLRKRLDHLLFDIDRRDNPRSKSRATRYQADTHLPPRRKPLVAKTWYGLSKVAMPTWLDTHGSPTEQAPPEVREAYQKYKSVLDKPDLTPSDPAVDSGSKEYWDIVKRFLV